MLTFKVELLWTWLDRVEGEIWNEITNGYSDPKARLTPEDRERLYTMKTRLEEALGL